MSSSGPQTSPRPRTRELAGQQITLLAGVRYMAGISVDKLPGERHIVAFIPAKGGPPEARTVEVVGLTYQQAESVLAAFLAPTSFGVRVW